MASNNLQIRDLRAKAGTDKENILGLESAKQQF